MKNKYRIYEGYDENFYFTEATIKNEDKDQHGHWTTINDCVIVPKWWSDTPEMAKQKYLEHITEEFKQNVKKLKKLKYDATKLNEG